MFKNKKSLVRDKDIGIKAKDNKKSSEADKNTLVRSLDLNIELFTQIFKNDETLRIRRFQNKFLTRLLNLNQPG